MVPAANVAEDGLSPSPIRCVLAGNIHDVGMRMVPAGKRIFDGGGLVIPDHGLAVHCMLVMLEFSPRASMTAPAAGYEPPIRMPCKIAQMLGKEDANVLASMKAPENPHKVEEEHIPLELYTALLPWLCASASVEKASNQHVKTATITKATRIGVDLVVFFMFFLSP